MKAEIFRAFSEDGKTEIRIETLHFNNKQTIMKAEEILNNNGLTGKLKCRNLELNEIDREDIVNCMKEYARIQIEKDRERVKAEIPDIMKTVKTWIDDTPITLD
jgi:hypothetical protein